MNVIKKILSNDSNKATMIFRLWCVAQIYYRQPLGDKAWKAMIKITDKQIVNAIAYISGFSIGMAYNTQERIKILKSFVPELEEK